MKDTRCLKYYLWWGKLDLNLKTKFACPTLTSHIVTCINKKSNNNRYKPQINIIEYDSWIDACTQMRSKKGT